MQDILRVLEAHTIEVMVGALFTFIGFIFKKGLNIYKQKVELENQIEQEKLKHEQEKLTQDSLEQAKLKDGLLSLLRYRINRLCYSIKEAGEITIDEQQDLNDMMSAYKDLGGNGRTHALYQEIIKLKVKI